MAEVEWWEFDSAADMAEQVAGDIGFVIESAIEAHGGARLAVPGGSTPDLIYKRLAGLKIDDRDRPFIGDVAFWVHAHKSPAPGWTSETVGIRASATPVAHVSFFPRKQHIVRRHADIPCAK